MVRFDEDARNVGDVRDITNSCVRPSYRNKYMNYRPWMCGRRTHANFTDDENNAADMLPPSHKACLLRE